MERERKALPPDSGQGGAAGPGYTDETATDFALICLAGTVNVKQRSLSDEESPCADHPKKKTSAYCNTCDVKVCLRCIISEHIPGFHVVLPYEDKFEQEDECLKKLVTSIQEDCEVAKKLESELERSKDGFVRGVEDLLTGIERDVKASRDNLKEQRDEEIKQLNDAYDKRTEELEKRYQQKVENVRKQEKDHLEDIERRLLENGELRGRSKAKSDEWAVSQAGLQLSELKEAIDKATTFSSELESKKRELTVITSIPREDNLDLVEHGELQAQVVTGCCEKSRDRTTWITLPFGRSEGRHSCEAVITLQKQEHANENIFAPAAYICPVTQFEYAYTND